MYLLILGYYNILLTFYVFTFHYVSINSPHETQRSFADADLHSTMYLLIRYLCDRHHQRKVQFTFHYVSINSVAALGVSAVKSLFTFHYVSINSRNGV